MRSGRGLLSCSRRWLHAGPSASASWWSCARDARTPFVRAYECSMVVVARATMAAAAAAVAREIKAIDIRRRQKRRKELKSQLTDLFSAGRGVPPELIQNILTFVGYDLVQADAPAYDLMRDDPREVDPSALKK